MDHCVQLTGYDTTGSVPYWEVRNSWAASCTSPPPIFPLPSVLLLGHLCPFPPSLCCQLSTCFALVSGGEEGYLRVEIGQNLCGIANEATWVAPGSVPPPPATDDAPPSDDGGSDDLY